MSRVDSFDDCSAKYKSGLWEYRPKRRKLNIYEHVSRDKKWYTSRNKGNSIPASRIGSYLSLASSNVFTARYVSIPRQSRVITRPSDDRFLGPRHRVCTISALFVQRIEM